MAGALPMKVDGEETGMRAGATVAGTAGPGSPQHRLFHTASLPPPRDGGVICQGSCPKNKVHKEHKEGTIQEMARFPFMRFQMTLPHPSAEMTKGVTPGGSPSKCSSKDTSGKERSLPGGAGILPCSQKVHMAVPVQDTLN